MNILLDTNILISLNDLKRPLDSSLAKMQKLLDKLSFHVFVHPSQRDDFERDNDIARKKINLSRLEQYKVLDSPPMPSPEELAELGWSQNNDHDRVDNILLYALRSHTVHVFVTEDQALLGKARRAGLQEQVFRIDQFLFFLECQCAPDFSVPVGIQEKPVYALHPQSDFWDSLRESYRGFDSWFEKICQEHRSAWCICDQNGDPLAVCIYKEEDSPAVTNEQYRLSGSVLKLCTFKVSRELQGRKLGERLLFTAFKFAQKNNIGYVYLHTRAQDKLIELCLDFGFSPLGKYNDDEVYYKQMFSPVNGGDHSLSPIDYLLKYYPYFIDDERVNKFIVPIDKTYHNELFPDVSDDAQGLFAEEFSCEKPQSNTIKKAYLSHSNTNQVSPGDVILFYRTGDRQSIEVIGVVEKAVRTQDLSVLTALVAKRTVYSTDELREWVQKPTLVILFRYVKTIPKIPYTAFSAAGIRGNIQAIRKIDHKSYVKLMEIQ